MLMWSHWRTAPGFWKGHTHTRKRLWGWGFTAFIVNLPYVWLYVFPSSLDSFQILRGVPHSMSNLWGSDWCLSITTERAALSRLATQMNSFPDFISQWMKPRKDQWKFPRIDLWLFRERNPLSTGDAKQKRSWHADDHLSYMRRPFLRIKPTFTSISVRWKLTTIFKPLELAVHPS